MTDELLAAIDAFMAEHADRNTFTATEVTDFALDLRLIASREQVPA